MTLEVTHELLEAEIANFSEVDRVLWMRFTASGVVQDTWAGRYQIAFESSDVIVDVDCARIRGWKVMILRVDDTYKSIWKQVYVSRWKHSLEGIAKAMIAGLRKYFRENAR